MLFIGKIQHQDHQTMEFHRILNLPELLEKKSFFLFGPRSTGKSHLIDVQLKKKALIIDLLDGLTHLRLLDNPSELSQIVESVDVSTIIVIDEIQKNPPLLDQVHHLIEKKKRRFLMTGSSARKLRTGGTNLLAGRAWEAQLFPLVSAEIQDFNLDRMLQFGGLPQVYPSDEPREELGAYVQTYLKEEIAAEGLVRKLPNFARFLTTAAMSNSELINFSSVGRDASISPSTVREYFSILYDTMLGFMVEPWTASKKRKAIETAKFYLFDTGVTHALAGTKFLDRNSDLYGKSFEQWVAMELRAYLSYRRATDRLYFWRSINGQEVDFVVGVNALEVKSSKRISTRDLSGLKALREEGVHKNLICVSHDPLDKIIDGMHVLHWKTFIKKLWTDQLIQT
jgi:predicted AAA+ superfamily ATPase